MRIKKTSQYIEGGATLPNYSTEEIKTGSTWIDGKPIYRKVIDLGNLPNNTTKDVATGLTHSNIKITKLSGVCLSGGYQTMIGDMYSRLNLRTDNTIRITTTIDYSTYTGYAILEYTKTTD